jgi:hypothetical protein
MGDLPSKSEFDDMFCWGNTVNGELGLGGIEEEHILLPRELNFNKTTNIKEGEFNGLCTHIRNRPTIQQMCHILRKTTPLLFNEEAPFQNM